MSGSIDYPALLRQATLGLVRDVLLSTAENGLEGEHHFYLTFRTGDEGVELPRSLRDRYPETMTVVLQHQFEELAVEEDAVSVTLRFGGNWERVRVPFAALTGFLDPSVPFGLDFSQFGGEVVPAAAIEEPSPADLQDSAKPPEVEGPADEPKNGDVLPFRRR